jgi:hypothetical protein
LSTLEDSLKIDDGKVSFALHLTALWETFFEQWIPDEVDDVPTFAEFMVYMADELDKIAGTIT